MGKVFFATLIFGTAAASLRRPWVGAVGAYLIAVLAPQTIWWWDFEGMRPAFWLTVATMIGFSIAALRKDLDFGIANNQRVWYVIVLWLAYLISYFFGPYTNLPSDVYFLEPSEVMSIINKMMILFLLACVCINDERKLRVFTYVLVGSGIYLVYWANMKYLSGQGWGRMEGPTNLYGRGIYRDGNNFAMLFVVVIPFLWNLGLAVKNKVIRWGMWLVIPFGWHAIFLTGSRGGLVGIAATMMLTIWRSESKKFAILLVPAFLFAYAWQAGDVMKERAATISEYQTESSSAARLDAWTVASRMIANHPVTGVGLASFEQAFVDHSDTSPKQAHNTFFQIAAESGVVAGLAYVLIIKWCLWPIWKNGARIKEKTQNEDSRLLFAINESVLVGFFGLIVCSMFLSLHLFEIFFYLCVVANSVIYVTSRPSNDEAVAVRAG